MHIVEVKDYDFQVSFLAEGDHVEESSVTSGFGGLDLYLGM